MAPSPNTSRMFLIASVAVEALRISNSSMTRICILSIIRYRSIFFSNFRDPRPERGAILVSVRGTGPTRRPVGKPGTVADQLGSLRTARRWSGGTYSRRGGAWTAFRGPPINLRHDVWETLDTYTREQFRGSYIVTSRLSFLGSSLKNKRDGNLL